MATVEGMLKSAVLAGKWKNVIGIYEKHAESHHVKINDNGDTAIHKAISDGAAESVVEALVSLCPAESLEIGDANGATPLHDAAYTGNVRICKFIAEREPRLIGWRDESGLTPLAHAVYNGSKSAFLCLQRICENQGLHEYVYYRRLDGYTILHLAIDTEHFDIAYLIIRRYPRLANAVSEDGVSPLHVLACKPFFFPSGTLLAGLSKLVYHCLSVSKATADDDVPSDVIINHPPDPICSGENHQPWDEEANEEDSVCIGENHRPDEEANEQAPESSMLRAGRRQWMSCLYNLGKPIYELMMEGLNRVMVFLVIHDEYESLRNRKQKRVWSVQVMNELVERFYGHPHKHHGICPTETPAEDYKYLADYISDKIAINDQIVHTPVITAAMNGVVEMVEKILDVCPDALSDVTTEKKNIVMLAAENRHVSLYKFLNNKDRALRTIFGQADEVGNSVLHIAANLGDDERPWRIRGPALEMHMEVKWYLFVQESVPARFFPFRNNEGKTAEQIFMGSHRKLMDESREWLTSYSNSASLVSALIATVAFTTSATVPGGVKQDDGAPTLEEEPVFIISAISSLVALSFSIIALVMFMVIPTSSFLMRDYRKDLPRKLLLGLVSLFFSILFMLVSFCAGHYFVLRDRLKYGAIPVNAFCCFALVVFIIRQFLLDFETVWIALKKEPQQQRD